MTDAYEPKLVTFSLTVQEAAAITAALATANPWAVENDDIKSVKKKIRDFHLERHENTCCYCRRDLEDGGYFMIDREHVLPKGKYKPYSFTIWNLSISCKRCNMELKGEDDEFVVNKTSIPTFQTSGNYLIVHPNFDEWETHLTREMQQLNKAVLVKFTVRDSSQKGRYTYEFFRLQAMEKDSFDRAQGINRKAMESQSEFVLEARSIARETGQ